MLTECDTNTDILSTNEFNVKKSLENKLVYKNGDNLTQNKNQETAHKIKEADEMDYLKDTGHKWTSAFFISGLIFIFSCWLSWSLSS